MESVGGRLRAADSFRGKEADYWREKFQQYPSNAGFSADFQGAETASRKTVYEPVSDDLAMHLAEVSKGNQRTLASIMLAGVAIVLMQRPGNRQVVIGAEGRVKADGEDIQYGVLPVVVDAPGGMSFREYMASLAADVRVATTNIPYPFERLAREMGRMNGPTNPFYDISVIREVGRPMLSYPLAPAGINVFWIATEDGKHIAASYDESRYDRQTVQAILRLTTHSLLTALAAPDTALSALSFPGAGKLKLVAKMDAPFKTRNGSYSH